MKKLLLTAVLLLAGCPLPSDEAPCASPKEEFRGKCVDPALRYEPDARVDENNVSAFGDALTTLKLPDPPKSGFRIVAPPRTLKPGEEDEFCLAWPYPQGLHNKLVYAARLYTTPGLHHSNVIAKPVNPKYGPNPYPSCNPGASDPINMLPAVIPDVLFANSTQIVGEESLVFPVGMAYRLDTTREIATSMHLLNTTQEPITAEMAYDFFTMEEGELANEVAPWTFQVDQFTIPAHGKKTIEGSCVVFGGSVVEMMPHTHKWRKHFSTDLLNNDGSTTSVLSYGNIDSGLSEIKTFEPGLDLTNVDKIHFACDFDNPLSHDMHFGIGENEMCVLFGYLTPVENQVAGHVPTEGSDCQSFQIGKFRP